MVMKPEPWAQALTAVAAGRSGDAGARSATGGDGPQSLPARTVPPSRS